MRVRIAGLVTLSTILSFDGPLLVVKYLGKLCTVTYQQDYFQMSVDLRFVPLFNLQFNMSRSKI